MKITYVTAAQIPSRWAHSLQAMKMAYAFHECGHEVEMITACSVTEWSIRNPTIIWEQYGVQPFRLMRLPLDWVVKRERRTDCGRLSYGYIAARYSKLRGADVIYTRNHSVPYWASKLGIQTIVETHSEPDSHYLKRRLIYVTRTPAIKALVTISKSLAESYVRAGVPKEKVIVEHDGVDLSAFSSVEGKNVSLTREHLLHGRKAVVMYTGHLYDYKGIPLILKVASKMPELSFVLVGGWERDIQRIRSLVMESGLTNVQLPGFVPNKLIPEFLSAADVLLLPYTDQHHQAKSTSPLKLFEYMASGRPIVASEIENVGNVLTNNRNAVLCAPDQVDHFVAGIEKILDDREFATELAAQARIDVRQFEWTERVKRILLFSGMRD